MRDLKEYFDKPDLKTLFGKPEYLKEPILILRKFGNKKLWLLIHVITHPKKNTKLYWSLQEGQGEQTKRDLFKNLIISDDDKNWGYIEEERVIKECKLTKKQKSQYIVALI